MTRLVGTPVPVFLDRVERGAPISASLIRDVWATTAGLWDAVTGDNAPALPINHTGGGAGALIGGPLVQFLPELNFTLSSSLSSTVPTHILVVPVPVPSGETELTVGVFFTDQLGNPVDVPFVKQVWVYDSGYTSASTPLARYEMERVDVGSYIARVTDHVAGALNYFTVTTEGIPSGVYGQVTLSGFCVYVDRMSTNIPPVPELATSGTAPTVTTTVSSATVGAPTDIHSEFLADDAALNCFVLSQLAKNMNTLSEYVTGFPAGHGASDSLVSSASRSAFADHTLNGKTNEHQTHHVLSGCGTGAMRSDFTTMRTVWPLGAAGGYNQAAGTRSVLAKVPVFMKEGSGRVLKCHLIGADLNTAGGTATLSVQCLDATGTSAGLVSTSMTLTSKAWKGTLSGIPYHAGQVNIVEVSVTSSKPKSSVNDFAALGFCLYEEAT